MDDLEIFTRNVGGEIVMSKSPGKIMRKWRDIFGLKQKNLASALGISSSVISDYESGRRKSPGSLFVQKFIHALILEDQKRGEKIIRKFIPSDGRDIFTLREFLTPIDSSRIIEAVKGEIVNNTNLKGKRIWGYTIIDSIQAILELSGTEFGNIYGTNPKRALIFTKVQMGRSPLIAVKVTQPKPSLIILHGLHPNSVDELAVRISREEKIPLVISKLRSERELTDNLGKIQEK